MRTSSEVAASRATAPRQRTLVSEGCARLEGLARAIGFEDELPSMVSTFRRLTSSWGEMPIDPTPAWASDVCDDHTPFELSVAIHGGEPELRVLAEAMDLPAGAAGSLAASRRLNEALAREGQVSLDRVRSIEGLFLPERPNGTFLVWHAAVFRRGRKPEFKIYYNLQVRGRSKASTLAQEALERLGFHHAWPVLAEITGRRLPEEDELLYFSLDLSPGPAARVKIYVRHHGGTAADLEAASSIARAYEPGAAAAFARCVGGSEGPYAGRGSATCFSFTDPSDDQPVHSTTYLPMPGVSPSDAIARQRILAFLRERGLPAETYEAALEASTRRRLESGSSLHSYAAFRWQDGPRVTAYFSPEIYRTEPARSAPVAWIPKPRRPAIEIVRHFESSPVVDHPLFARLRREPVDLGKLAVIMANFQRAVVHDFPRRLATLTARVGDEGLRSILAKQLNDELGNGDITRAHRVLFQRITKALAPWSPAVSEDLVAPGRALGEVIEACYVSGDPYQGVGASLVVEVGGKQVDIFIADEFRRQTLIPPSDLEWLHLHETLELEHVDESVELAGLIPSDGEGLEAAWRGGIAIGDAARRYFDALYRMLYA
jgi:DMATS type aromatic prenyltransferase